MKTINLKFKLVLFTALFSIVFWTGNVSANTPEKENPTTVSEIEAEPELQLENWMLDQKLWEQPTLNLAYAADNEVENGLAVESWMTDEFVWSLPGLMLAVNDQDEKLNIESWMLQDNFGSTGFSRFHSISYMDFRNHHRR